MSDNHAPDTTDMELYRRFMDRDREAHVALVELYGEELTAYINRIVGNMYDAEELMIDVFTRLVRSKEPFQGKASLKTYLFAIGKNLALRHLEKHGRDHVAAELIEDILESGSGTGRPETEALREERRRQLNEAMIKLKPEHREVLRLLYFENMSYANAGKAMKKTARQIDGLSYRAKASLKKKLESEGFIYAEE